MALIDDHVDNLELLTEALHASSYAVRTASGGEEGVRIFDEDKPLVAIVDIGLPDIDGYEVSRRICQVLGDRIRLIALSGYGQPFDRERANAAGFNLHLTKPANLRALKVAIEGRAIRLSGSIPA